MLPNFLIGGVAAAGTNFLTASITQHPDIYLPEKMFPEVHFFYKSWEHKKGAKHYETNWFSSVKNEKAIGERSSSYLFGGTEVAKKIKALLPDAKLIFTLRNPIERTWANYRFTVLNGLEDLPFKDALRNEKQRIAKQSGKWAEIQPHNYTGRGFYARQLKEYLRFFPEKNILLIKSEDMGSAPQETFRKVFDFLEVDKNYTPSLPPNFTSLSVKDPALQMQFREYFGDRFNLIIEAVRRNKNPQVYAKSAEEEKLLSFVANLKNIKEEMSVEIRSDLQDLFQQDMDELKELVDFSIEDWR